MCPLPLGSVAALRVAGPCWPSVVQASNPFEELYSPQGPDLVPKEGTNQVPLLLDLCSVAWNQA